MQLEKTQVQTASACSAAATACSGRVPLAALTSTSRETATKILGEFADQDLVGRGRGRINISTRSNFGRLSGGLIARVHSFRRAC